MWPSGDKGDTYLEMVLPELYYLKYSFKLVIFPRVTQAIEEVFFGTHCSHSSEQELNPDHSNDIPSSQPLS